MSRSELQSKIFQVTEQSFTSLVIELFRYQYENNEVYHQFCSLMNVVPSGIESIHQVPFLPIEIFKTHKVVTCQLPVEKIFRSSGTTGSDFSQHFVSSLKIYEESFLRTFENFFGNPQQYCILALLPSYLERDDSSLVYMAEHLIRKTGHPDSGFFLSDQEALVKILQAMEKKQQRTLLVGVTFALLDLAERYSLHLTHTLVMETGGMKGRREEITRESLHGQLKEAFGVKQIYSEYGMTELLSQAYLMEDNRFHAPKWMRILIRDVNDPLQIIRTNMTGGINVIDLANLDSCSFIATADLGKTFNDETFDVLGRMDYSDLRGCNLMWDSQ